ncbi:Fat-like cadherin-related tumor suppressor-like [Papilio machaon]|uniref:Fat-like cadherin-related tumor suppressor-like n=1 Tax=Papilio machaon TaxID=76193 RepID=A0A0N1IPF3_PAPMA|nr:Fat-like cadherin-related tumor suppressor-like [Papilio machaon]
MGEPRLPPAGADSTATVTVEVTNENDCPPQFSQAAYEAEVLLPTAAGVRVLVLEAQDADGPPAGALVFDILEGDPEGASEAEVSVRAWGGGATPRWPRAHYELEAREDAAPGRALTPTLQAEPPLGRALIYTLHEGPAELFEVHFETDRSAEQIRSAVHKQNRVVLCAVFAGAVVPRAALDYEAAREHRLGVRATDTVSGAFADVTVLVRVLDVNDCAPRFERDEYRVSVREAAPVGASLLTVQAADDDQGDNGNVTYSLSAWGSGAATVGAVGALPFAVGAHSGEVTVAGALDREQCAEHHLLLTAADAGQPALHTTAHLFITIRSFKKEEHEEIELYLLEFARNLFWLQFNKKIIDKIQSG